MGTIYASAIFTEADGILLDAAKTRWTDAEKLRYLNAGQRQAVIFRPDVYTVNDVYRLVEGTRQRIPDGTSSYQNASGTTLKEGIQLMRLVRNMTVLSNLLASWANVSYDTLTASGPNITSAISLAGGSTATSAAIALTPGHSYRLEVVEAQTSGAGPTISGTAGFTTTAISAGKTNITFTATAASMVLTLTNASAGSWSGTFFLYDRTAYPSITHDHLVAGNTITPVGADFLDAYSPDWHSDTEEDAVSNYAIDDRDPARFYVTPPNTGDGYVEAVFSACPADIVASAGPPVSYDVVITLSDIYRDILLNYVLYRCYAKDAALSPLNAQMATAYWNLFVLGLDRKDLVKKEYTPNQRQPNPSTE